MPPRIAALLTSRGYPVPWFVAWLDENEEAVPPGRGFPDFRVLHPRAIVTAVERKLCWICGNPFALGASQAFVIGPMCAVNRTSAEPPSHVDCADWAARACPFLVRPKMVRREAGMPAEAEAPAGLGLARNPGVAMVWITLGGWKLWRPPTGGLLFHIGEPAGIRWYAEGRKATRTEILESIETGLPALRAVAALEEGGLEHLDRQVNVALELLPV